MAIDIAVIDSGINPNHPHVGAIASGITVFRDASSGRIEKRSGCEDRIGHGTAIAGLIRHYEPSARLHAVKIFDNELKATGEMLLTALDSALSLGCKIIHLSLGTTTESYREHLEELCRRARRQNIVIVAAARTQDDSVMPAVFDTVWGVSQDLGCPFGVFVHHPGRAIQLGAHGYPRPLPGLPQERNFHGSSFAAAHVTGKLAQMLTADPALLNRPTLSPNLIVKNASDHGMRINTPSPRSNPSRASGL